MTETLPRPSASGAGGGREFEVRELRRVSAIEEALGVDRALAAYALGHLEFELFPLARFWSATGAAGSAIVMHGRALGPTMVAVGAPSAVAAIVALHPGPRRSYLSTAAPEHRDALDRYYRVSGSLTMQRMTVDAASFQQANGPVRRLRGSDANRINALYATEGGPSRYSYDAIERAIYYGIYEGHQLVSVAGTHIVAPNQGIAVVGNVFTAASVRSRGYASAVTSAVTRELLERGCSEVVLTVDPANGPAVRAYERLGYRFGSEVIEAQLTRRDTLGIGPMLRRRRARRRGGEPGVERITLDR